MNERSSPMDELQQELFEKQLLSLSKGLNYPSTPDIAGSVMRHLRVERTLSVGEVGGEARAAQPRSISRKLAWSLTVIIILFSSLMLIPPARAAILEFIQIGVVRIFRTEPTPLPPPTAEFPSTLLPLTPTPAATSAALIPLLENIAGETTLKEAQKAADYPLLLPSYPPDLGQPDRVFVQDVDGTMTVLVWLDPQKTDRVLMSLHFLPSGSWAVKKVEPTLIQETTVRGQRAIWTIGPYPLLLSNGDVDFTRLINGHVLIWAEGRVTYRLETDLPLEEALKIAESLQPIAP
ncbi:MAG TPA: hypothetical protein VK249_16645 [Anaerolineales bacterium]|nr:hypothetical protein [Anaerolineales bacterium]